MTGLPGIGSVVFVDIELIVLSGIVSILLSDADLVGRLVVVLVLVGTDWASRTEGLGSHGLSRLFGHFDFESFVLFVD